MKVLLLLLIPLQIFSQGKAIIFENVNIIDVEKATLVRNQNILIEGKTIKLISSKEINRNSATRIDGTGKYLIPGLCDFNASVLVMESEGSPALKMMVAHGVTSVRDLSPPHSLQQLNILKQQIEDGSLLGPHLYLSGKTVVDRPPSASNGGKMYYVKSETDALLLMDSMVKHKVDVIEVRNIKSQSILRTLTGEAHKNKIKVMERLVGDWMEASNAGVDAFTHLSDLWRTTSVGRERIFQIFKKDSVISTQYFYNNVLPSLGNVDTAYFYLLMKTLKQNNTWLCTGTTSYFQSINTFEHGDTSRMKYRTARQKQSMEEDLKLQTTLTSDIVKGSKPDMSQLLMAHKSGVPVIAGTQLFSLMTAGMSTHDMLFWLVDGGFTPAEALRTATLNPAIFLNKQKETGTVTVGKRADMVLLDANPLEDISNTRKINTVVVNGKLLQRIDLDKLLEEVKEKVKADKNPKKVL